MTVSENLDHVPFARYLGIQLVGGGAGSARCRLTLDANHENSLGFAHGAVMFAMAEACMGEAVRSRLEANEFCVTVEIKINFLRPASGPILDCRSSIVSKGRSLSHAEAEVWSTDRFVAKASGTFAIRARDGRPS